MVFHGYEFAYVYGGPLHRQNIWSKRNICTVSGQSVSLCVLPEKIPDGIVYHNMSMNIVSLQYVQEGAASNLAEF